MKIENCPTNKITYYKKPQSPLGITQRAISPIQPIPLITSRAYVSPAITQGYRELTPFELPLIGTARIYELSNGHKIVIIPKKGQTYITTTFLTGQYNDPIEKKELNHLLEHLIANYIIKADEKTKSLLDRTGASVNANTSSHTTDYKLVGISLKPEDTEILLKLQSEMLTNRSFSPMDIQKEKKIITQENNDRNSKSKPIVESFNSSFKILYNLPETSSILKTFDPEEFKTITNKDLENYYNNYYTSTNSITTIIGNVDNNTIKYASKYLGSLPKKEVKPIQPDLSNPIKHTIRKDEINSNPMEKNTITGLAFAENIPANIYDELVIETLIAIIENRIPYLDIFLEHNYPDGKNTKCTLFMFHSIDKNSPEKWLNQIYSEINSIHTTPVSEKELNLAKAKINAKWTEYAENSENLSSNLNKTLLYNLNPDRKKDFQTLKSLTPTDIQAAAVRFLDLNKVALSVIHPQKSKQSVSFKGKMFDTENIEDYNLKNNIRVVFEPGASRAAINFTIESQKHNQNLKNTAEFLNLLFYKTAEDKYFDKCGIQKEVRVDPEKISFSLDGAPQYIEMLISAAQKLMFYTEFNEDNVDFIKNILKTTKENNEFLTREALLKSLFYDTDDIAAESNLNEITATAVNRNLNSLKENSQCTVTITLPEEELKKYKSTILNELSLAPVFQPYNYNKVFNRHKAVQNVKNKIFVNENNSNSLNIEKYFKIITTGNIKDEAGLAVINYIIGGDDKSKLFTKLRTNDSLAYSAYSFIEKQVTQNLYLFHMQTSVPSELTDSLRTTLNEYNSSVSELINTPISSKELTRATNYIKANILKSMEKSSEKNKMLTKEYNSFYGKNYRSEFIKTLDELTPYDIQQLAKYYLTQPSYLMISGNKDIIERNKNYLNTLGEVEFPLFQE